MHPPIARDPDLSTLRLHLVGCGRMGGALLQGWLATGLKPAHVSVSTPHPDPWLSALCNDGLRLSDRPDTTVDVLVVATKPNRVRDVAEALSDWDGDRTLVVSIAAGLSLSALSDLFGARRAIVRLMPNLPASIRMGVSGLVANDRTFDRQREIAKDLARSVGFVVALENEDQMHALTAVSGSGPAYMFALAELLQREAERRGLPAEAAGDLVAWTVAGSGELLRRSGQSASHLRAAVTSPAGTTEAALTQLLRSGDGLEDLLVAALDAAVARSRELGA